MSAHLPRFPDCPHNATSCPQPLPPAFPARMDCVRDLKPNKPLIPQSASCWAFGRSKGRNPRDILSSGLASEEVHPSLSFRLPCFLCVCVGVLPAGRYVYPVHTGRSPDLSVGALGTGGSGSCQPLWVLGKKPGSCTRAGSALNHQVFSPVLRKCFLQLEI